MQVITGNIIDIFEDEIYYGEILVRERRIFGVKRIGKERPQEQYISPGLVDAHVHIESSMLVPAEFAKLAVVHGTLATVSDPHEIANVLGVEGVEYMIDNGETVPFKFSFGVPSCVPATTFETAGAVLGLEEVSTLLSRSDITYLAEMMNFPGIIHRSQAQIQLVEAALAMGKKVDGHAPGLQGDDAKRYFEVGITTDHECFTQEEALGKLKLGVKVLLREGSAAKNFEALIPLAKTYAHQMMFCSDDKHPDELVKSHINDLVKRAIASGVDYFDALRMAILNPVLHYEIPLGMLREGDSADFVIWSDKESFNCVTAFINGECIMENRKASFSTAPPPVINNFNTKTLQDGDLNITLEALSKPDLNDSDTHIRVIKVLDGQLITQEFAATPTIVLNNIVSDTAKDILKLVVYNRYEEKPPAIAFINGFGIKEGAIASTVAHDSHNIIAVGADDESIIDAINLVIKEKGGISAVSSTKQGVLGLPIAGLMSDKLGEIVAEDYEQIDAFSKQKLGSTLKSPFMSLSFMALLVIPQLKLSDKGLFDGGAFEFVELGC